MRNETGESSKSASPRDAKELEADVRRAVEQGEDIQENVRRLTLMALGAEPLDLEAMRRTMSAVVHGAETEFSSKCTKQPPKRRRLGRKSPRRSPVSTRRWPNSPKPRNSPWKKLPVRRENSPIRS